MLKKKMCSNDLGLLGQLKDLVCQIDDNKCAPCAPCSPCQPCVGPTGFTEPCFPFAQVVMTCPPPIMLPTSPRPVKPLQLPCPPCPREADEPVSPQYDRYANFYNNYNMIDGVGECGVSDPRDKLRQCGVTVDGQRAKCEDYKKRPRKKPISCCGEGCPTGFKPCNMELRPPPCCDPWGVWCAKIQPCPPKPKVSGNKNFYDPSPCKRPCCKHWKPEDPCLYDAPCKAHCFNHPPGMKPSGKTAS